MQLISCIFHMYDLSTLRRASPRKEIKQKNFFTFITQYNFRFKTLPKGPLYLILYKQKKTWWQNVCTPSILGNSRCEFATILMQPASNNDPFWLVGSNQPTNQVSESWSSQLSSEIFLRKMRLALRLPTWDYKCT